ncbi:MAG: carbonic anhydrase, partial [Maribacter sp.]|nr:carbonic anhydrase [Maribacter sp.]
MTEVPGTSAKSHDPVDALLELVAGNDRFSAGQSTHPNLSAERRELVTSGGQ